MAVVIAGGTSGIGLAVAERFAKSGRTIVLNYARDSVAAQAAKEVVGATGADVHVVQADLSGLDGVRALADYVKSLGVPIEQLVCATAAGVPGSLLDLEGERLELSVQLNGMTIAHLVRELLPMLSPGSAVFFVTSAGARRALPGYGALGAPKALAEHLVRYLALELAPRGIRINCISPGPIDTKARREMFPDTWEERLRDQIASSPAGRGVTMEEIAGVVECMSQPEFAMVQGQVITIDGGLTL